VEIIDDDLGRSASGTVARSGFDRLVAWLCAGKVGAVLCFDASRLARNGRDWHHLLELCGLVGARVIDLDGVYKRSSAGVSQHCKSLQLRIWEPQLWLQ
jgi:DNA invertase Pin-like site-specific DNA recombinase